MQAAAFLALHGLAGDEVAHVDHVAQLTVLESFAHMQSQEEADELSRVIRD